MKRDVLQSSNLMKIKQIEEDLIASEVSYRRLFESAKDGILILDAETGMIVDVNPFLINLLGFSKEQFVNKHIWELGFFKDILINKDKFLELQLKEYVRYEDLPLETAEGEKIHVEFVSNVYLVNNQKIIQCNIRDITERFHAQEERQKAMKEIEMISRFPMENPNPILRFNNDCILLFANVAAVDFISFCGCEIGRVAPLFVYDLIKGVIDKGTNQVIEMQFGDKIWLMTFVPLIADAYVNLYCDDITERKKAEDNNLKLFNAVEKTADIIFITDREGIIEYVNPAFESITGYSKEEAIDNTPRILNSGKMDMKYFQGLWATILNGEVLYSEMINRRKNGELFFCEQTITPVKNIDGYVTNFISTGKDITERRHAVDSLKLFRSLIDQSNDAIEVLDPETGRFLDVNDKGCSELGYSREEFLSLTVFDIDPMVDKSIFKRVVEEVRKSGFMMWEGLHRRKDGSKFPVEVNIKYVRLERDYMITVARDITERKGTEEAVRESERRYREVIENASDIIFTTDIDGNILFGNNASLRVAGYSFEDFTKMNYLELTLPEYKRKVKSFYMKQFLSKLPTSYIEYPLKNKSGDIIWLGQSANLIFENDQIKGFHLLARDITERKKVEVALKKSEEDLKESQRIAHIGSWYLDLASNQVLWTDELYRMYGFDPTLPPPPYSEHKKLFTPKSWEKLSNALANAVKTGIPYELELETLKIDGSNGWLWVHGKTVIDETGKTVGLFGATQDITERKQVEEDLRESEERYSTIVNSSPNLILIHVNDIIKYVNNIGEILLEYPTEEIIGKSILDFVSKESKPIVIDNMQRRTAGEDVPSYEVTVITKSGAEKFALIQATIIHYQKEKAFLAVVTDITQIKEYERELILSKDKAEEMSRLKSSFLANMSHELRTPMIGILGFSKLLAYSEDVETKETGELIYTSGKRLMDTLNLILDLSRIEAGESKLELSNVDLIEEIAETVNLYQVAALEKNLLLSFSSEYEHLYTRTDKKAIDSILNNLINNAVKYTYKGSIKVTVAKMKRGTEDWALIEVTDTGIGIEEKNINMIFREFRQVSEGLERSFDGTGLGLTLTKKYTELIGGTITVKSMINEGSTFTVRFPIVPVSIEVDDLQREEEIIQEEIQKEIIHKKNILIVEDDKVTIIYVQRILKDKYIIDTATNAMEAIELVEKKKYDLILMDINLGRSRNGIFTTKEIRKMNNYKDTPIIAMTAFAMKGDKEDFLAEGFSYYISKPFESDELIELMNEALGSAGHNYSEQ